MTLSKKISTWLFICAASVFLMALIGATTRLTESGLSITEWKPIAGALPPLNAADWQHEFDLYQQSPQYLKVNHGMTLDDFKHIFFWEWLHRLWGRMIGLIYALPLAYFWLRGQIPIEKRKAFLRILALGFMQGAMGWYMVKSGLVDRPEVSHYRLAAHLLLAFLIYSCLFRLGLSFHHSAEAGAENLTPIRKFTRSTIAAAALTMTWGAFVAGLDAGMIYNTFPMMDNHWLPVETASFKPMWQAFFAEPATVQFTHRILAMLTFAKVMTLVYRARKLQPPRRLGKIALAVGAMVCLQVALGISTLLTQVNIILAVSHQAGAMILLTLLVWMLHEIPKKRTIDV